MVGQVMIYGATGYTGKLIARLAKAHGLCPILAGRNLAKLKALADPLGCPYRVVRLDLQTWLQEALTDVGVVLNLSGPFSTTARPLVDACLRTATHYLDVTGELPVFVSLHGRDAEARARRVTLMPGIGNCVVSSDCLAAYVAGRLPDAQYLRIGMSRAELVSQGSVKTVIEMLTDTVTVVRNGALTPVPLGSLEHTFHDGEVDRSSTALSWGDVFTAFQTTGIPNIEIYLEVNASERLGFELIRRNSCLLTTPPGKLLLRTLTTLLPEGPSYQERVQTVRTIVAEAAEAKDGAGQQVRACLRTPEAYTFTATTALAIVERVLAGDYQTGFQTPAQVYGADFVLNFDGVSRTDLSR